MSRSPELGLHTEAGTPPTRVQGHLLASWCSRAGRGDWVLTDPEGHADHGRRGRGDSCSGQRSSGCVLLSQAVSAADRRPLPVSIFKSARRTRFLSHDGAEDSGNSTFSISAAGRISRELGRSPDPILKRTVEVCRRAGSVCAEMASQGVSQRAGRFNASRQDFASRAFMCGVAGNFFIRTVASKLENSLYHSVCFYLQGGWSTLSDRWGQP